MLSQKTKVKITKHHDEPVVTMLEWNTMLDMSKLSLCPWAIVTPYLAPK